MIKQKRGGRTLGTPNKTTKQLKEKLSIVIENELEMLDDTLASLEPKTRLELVIKLLNYVIPKAVETQDTEPITLKIVRTIVDGNGNEIKEQTETE